MGQRRRGARARLPRHVPGGRVLAPRRQHPADRSPSPSTAAPTGADLVRGIATGYEIQVDLVRGICLHEHKIDHVAHLGPSAAAGIGTLLGLDRRDDLPGRRQALHVTTATRQSRKGEISSWKAYAPAFAGKMAVEAVDRAMRGETAPSPIYEGEDGVIAWLLGGPDAAYEVPLPEPGEPKRGDPRHLHQGALRRVPGQALIDLARRWRTEHRRPDATRRHRAIVLHTSHHTHYVIGTGANDPQKFDPDASPRDPRPLDHVHLRGRAAGRRLAPRRLLRARARAPARHRRAVAQGLAPSKTPSGPGATTRPIRPRRRSAAAS